MSIQTRRENHHRPLQTCNHNSFALLIVPHGRAHHLRSHLRALFAVPNHGARPTRSLAAVGTHEALLSVLLHVLAQVAQLEERLAAHGARVVASRRRQRVDRVLVNAQLGETGARDAAARAVPRLRPAPPLAIRRRSLATWPMGRVQIRAVAPGCKRCAGLGLQHQTETSPVAHAAFC